MPDAAILMLGDQLFPALDGMPADAPVFLREDVGLATRTLHHRQKLVLFFGAMRRRADGLRQDGRDVAYRKVDDDDGRSFWDALGRWMADRGPRTLHAWTPADRFCRAELRAWSADARIVLVEHENPGFLTPPGEWDRYAAGRRRLMGDFYRIQRRRLNLLLDEAGDPVGGKWSFDEANRRPVPRGAALPGEPWVGPDPDLEALVRFVDEAFPGHPGRAADFGWAIDREGALAWLRRFLHERFADFGPYEDAILADRTVLWHSALSPYLNCGLLTPREVVGAAVGHARRHDVPIESLEGFVRQVVGWREFIRGIDEDYGRSSRDPLVAWSDGKVPDWASFPHQNRRLGRAWWTGDTGLPPLDAAIRRTLRHGWCHHIERLMVVGSAMLMAGVHPMEAYRWFMAMFVDSADWVMAPNVFGMSQYADGGVFATKPYLSGSAYLRRMSDHPPGEWCDVWDGLYWRFVHQNRTVFARNPRLSAMANGVDRLDPVRRARIFAAAEDWIARVTLDPAPEG